MAGSPGKSAGAAGAGLPPSIAAALEPVRRRFVDMAEGRILAIESLSADIARGVNVEQSMREIARLAHKIAGVAGTLGFAQIGDHARQVEQGLDGTGSALPPRDRWIATQPDVESLLDALEAVLDE